MSAYALTPLAKADIFEIWSYIAGGSDSEEIANRVELAIYGACAFIAEAATRGHSRVDLTSRPLRFWTLTRYPNYTVVYRPETSPIQIIAVLHRKRDIRRTPETAAIKTRHQRLEPRRRPRIFHHKSSLCLVANSQNGTTRTPSCTR